MACAHANSRCFLQTGRTAACRFRALRWSYSIRSLESTNPISVKLVFTGRTSFEPAAMARVKVASTSST